MITVYHNPRCSKSRECLAFIENSNQQYEIIKYMENPLSYKELREIIRKLKIKPIALIRQSEALWQEQFKGKTLTPKQLIQAMVDYPVLMQRPIAVNGEKAVIARPFDKISTII